MPKNKKLAWAAAVVWMGLIFFLSQQPASVSSSMSAGITGFILDLFKGILDGNDTEIEKFHTLVRKNAHFIAYFILGSLLLNAIRTKGKLLVRDVNLAFAASVVYAASDEFHQLFIDGRSGEIRDVLIDSAGAATGIAVYWVLYTLVKRKEKREVSALR